MALHCESIKRVKERNEAVGRYWFSEGTIRFFQSRVGSTAYLTKDGKRSYFVSSERGRITPRLYSVRVQNTETGEISTVGEFQEYRSRYNAHKVAKVLAKGETTGEVYHTLDGRVVI